MDRRLAYVVPLLLSLAGPGPGAEPGPTSEVILADLDNPCGVAVQPETGHVFVSDSGRGRVIRVVEGQLKEVVVGFPRERYGQDPGYQIGPLGLAFLNRDTLVIGGGGQAAGEDVVSIVSVPAAGSPPIRADQALQFGPMTGERGGPGEGDFYSIATTGDAIFVTSNGDDQQGWVLAIPIRQADQLNEAAGYGQFTRFLATKPRVQVDAPMAIALSPRNELVIGQMGELSDVADSRLTFYRLDDGKPLLDLAAGLYDVAAIAYAVRPTRADQQQLYALDLAAKVPEAGGLYRLDARLRDGQLVIAPTRIAQLDHPTAMARGLDDALYVTLLGTAAGADSPRPGKLVRFAPGW
jgi:hypothetical protein